jgi:hypothetical protein
MNEVEGANYAHVHVVGCFGQCDAEPHTCEPQAIPSKPVMYAAVKRLYDVSNVRNGLLIHNPEEAVDAIRAALLAVPVTLDRDR